MKLHRWVSLIGWLITNESNDPKSLFYEIYAPGENSCPISPHLSCLSVQSYIIDDEVCDDSACNVPFPKIIICDIYTQVQPQLFGHAMFTTK